VSLEQTAFAPCVRPSNALYKELYNPQSYVKKLPLFSRHVEMELHEKREKTMRKVKKHMNMMMIALIGTEAQNCKI
jgi:hypothetical protein